MVFLEPRRFSWMEKIPGPYDAYNEYIIGQLEAMNFGVFHPARLCYSVSDS